MALVFTAGMGAVLAAGCGGTDSTPQGGAISITPEMIAFPETAINTTSPAQTITVRNNSSTTLSKASYEFMAGADVNDFTFGPGNCGESLRSNSVCTITVSFTPKSVGEKKITISYKAQGSAKSVALSGTAIRAAELTIDPPSGAFGTVAVGGSSMPSTFTVKNQGTKPTTMPPALTATAEFVLQNNRCMAGVLAGGATCTVEVVFQPQTAGAKSGFLSAAVPGSTFMIPLSGIAQSMPRLIASPTPLEFPDTVVEAKSAARTVTVMNPSASPLTGFTATASTGDFMVASHTCGAMNPTVPAGGACTVMVVFSPRSAGLLRGELALGFTGGVATQVPLSGTGLRKGQLTVSPTSHGFGSISVGQTSGSVSFTVKNDGQEDANGVKAEASGPNAADFLVTNSCPASLRPAGECTVAVRYKPMALGNSTASLTISGTPGGSQAVALTGTGVAPATITITPDVQEFGMVAVDAASRAFEFTVRNTGGMASGRLTVSTVGTEFQLPTDANGCKDISLPAGGSCVLSVIFRPSTAGARTSNLTVASEAAGTVSASLTGTAISPPVLSISPTTADFGPVGMGAMSSEVTFTVTNTGGTPSGLITAAPSSTQFQVSTNGCLNKTLAPTENCQVGVRFVPTATGPVTAKLNVSSPAGGTTSADLTGSGIAPPTLVFQNGSGTQTLQEFGDVNVGVDSGTVTLFLRNTGNTATGMLAATLEGSHPGDFRIVAGGNNCMAPLPATGQCSIAVVFRPTAAGVRSAVLTITSATGGSGSILLRGSGTALLQVRRGGMQVARHDFDEVTVGLVTASETFTLFAQAATGTYTVSFDGGGSPPNFSFDAGTCTGTPLAANGTCTFSARFQPQSKGAKTGKITFTTSAGVTTSLDLAGTGIGPLRFSPSPHNFGEVATGQTKDQAFTLTNQGDQAATGVAVSITGDDFSVTSDTCATSPPVGGGTCTITVRFIPSTSGPKTGTLTAVGSYLIAGQTVTDTATVAITGQATAAASISVTPAMGSFGEVAVGAAPAVRSFMVTNAAGVSASGGIGRAITGAGYSFVAGRNGCVLADNTTPRPLGPGESCSFDVQFAPASTGTLTGTLTVSAEPGGTVRVPLTGTGLTSLALAAMAYNLDVSDTGTAVENVLGQVNPKRRVTVTNRSTTDQGIPTSLVPSSLVGATGDGPTYFSVTPDATAGATPCGPTLGAGASCTFQVQLVTPTGGTAGDKKAVLRVGTSPTAGASAELSGTMLRDANMVFLDQANRDFGSVVVGTSSGSHTIQLRNTGGVTSGPIQMFDLEEGFTRLPAMGTNAATGNPICRLGDSLAVGATCDILLQFAPTSPGMKTTTLRVYVTGPGSATGGTFATPNVRTLTGVGLAAMSAQLTPTPVDFGTAPAGTATPVDRTVTFTNLTGGALVVLPTDIALGTGTAGFSVVPGSNCIGPIAGGVQCTVTVRFQPAGGATQGIALDTLIVAGSRASLLGTVTRAPALEIVPPTEGANWGEALVGQAAAKRTFTIRNRGDAATGDAPSVTIGGAQASEFAIASGDNGCTAALPAGGSCTVAVTLTPAAIGARAATMDATATGSTAATTVALAANGVLPNAVQIVSINGVPGSATTVSFGDKAVGSETAIDVVIKNADNAQRITTPTFGFSDSTNFRHDINADTMNDCFDEIADNGGLEGGEACTVRLFFRPQALPAGTTAPNLSSTFTVGGAATTLALTVQGNAVSALSVTPTAEAFGSVAVNNVSSERTFTVRNSSDPGVGATGQVFVTRTGADAASFRITSNECAGRTLAPGATCLVKVVFEPTTAGAKTATLSIAAVSTNGASAALTGTGM